MIQSTFTNIHVQHVRMQSMHLFGPTLQTPPLEPPKNITDIQNDKTNVNKWSWLSSLSQHHYFSWRRAEYTVRNIETTTALFRANTSYMVVPTSLLIIVTSYHYTMIVYKSLTAPNPPKSSKGHFFGKIQRCWKLVLSPRQMGQNYYLARSTGHKCWIWKDQQKCMVHFEDKGMFPKVHWRILEIQEGS